MSETKQPVVVQTDEYYEFNIERNDVAAFEMWNSVKDFLYIQGYTFLPDVQKRVNKWLKQREKIFTFIQTSIHHDCKVVGLGSYRENGNILMHDVIAMTPVMEQPFRKILIECLQDWAIDEKIEIIVPKIIHDAITFEDTDTVTIDTAKKALDIGTQEMKTMGTNTAVVTL